MSERASWRREGIGDLTDLFLLFLGKPLQIEKNFIIIISK